MRFKIDENLPAQASRLLRSAGHNALSVLEQKMGGRPDGEVAAVCKAEARILVTLDTDFSNIVAYPPKDFAGIAVLRPEEQSMATVLAFVQRMLDAMQTEAPEGKLWIVESQRIRIRGSE